MNLPVNRRNYLDLAALTPGVARVDDYVGISDAPLAQAPQSGLSFGGNNGRGNVFWLDGGENYINTGGVRPSISQEGWRSSRSGAATIRPNSAAALAASSMSSRSSGQTDNGTAVSLAFCGTAACSRKITSIRKRPRTPARKPGHARRPSPARPHVPLLLVSNASKAARAPSWPSAAKTAGPFGACASSAGDIADFLLIATGDPQLAFTRQCSPKQLLLTTNFPATLDLFRRNRGMSSLLAKTTNQGSLRVDHRFSRQPPSLRAP
jgi:hypothetical protein